MGAANSATDQAEAYFEQAKLVFHDMMWEVLKTVTINAFHAGRESTRDTPINFLRPAAPIETNPAIADLKSGRKHIGQIQADLENGEYDKKPFDGTYPNPEAHRGKYKAGPAPGTADPT